MSNNEINQLIQEANEKLTPEQFEEFRGQRKNELVLEMVALRERARFNGDRETVAKCTTFLNKAMMQAVLDDIEKVMQ